MTRGLILDLALSEEQNLEINTEACKRVRHRQNECRICADICPEQAISFELGPTINEACTQCGLCINACPTDTIQNNIDMEQYWLDQIRILAEKNRKQTLHLHCRQAQEANDHSVALHCVGNLSENLLLGSTLHGFRKLVINTGHCHECALAKGVALFDATLSHAGDLNRLISSDDLNVQLVSKPKLEDEEKVMSRRAFFSSLTRQVKEKTVPADYARTSPLHNLLNFAQDEAEQEQQRKSPRRERLRQLLNKAKQKPVTTTSQTVEHWQKMFVEQEKCVACAVCINVCPTGALHKTITDNVLYRYYNSALCTNCGTCQEACPQQIIHFKENYTLADIVEDNQQLVARVELNQCLICGETIPVIEGKVCTTCQKRQISPMFF